MSWNGAGVFNRIYSWVADKNAGIDITASRMDTDTDDITSNGFGNTLTRDGQGSATANLPMNTFRHTGVGNGVARTDYAALGQVEDGVINWAVASGTSDAIAVSVLPAVVALVDGQLVFFRASAANTTTTPTFSLNSLTAYTITKAGGTALAIGDIAGNLAECIVRYNLANTRWELLNPASGVIGYGGQSSTVTITIAAPGVITWTGHGLPGNAQVEFSTTGALPTGLSAATPYYVVQSSITTNTFQVSSTKGGAPITTSGSQSGTQSATATTVAGNLAAFSSSAGTTLKDGGPPLFGAPNLLASAVAFGVGMLNGTIDPSVASNVLTLALKTLAGADPSAQDPVWLFFRDATAANADYTAIALTSALSIAFGAGSSGSNFGSSNATPFRLWIVAFNDGGTVRLGVINCLSGTNIYPLQQQAIASSTQVAATGSNSAQTFYTNGAAVSSKAYTVLGSFSYEAGSTLSTAGAYAATPTRMDLFRPGVPLPGQSIQRVRSATGTVATGTTTFSLANSQPANTNGDQYMSQAITPSSSADLLRINFKGNFASGIAGAFDMTAALFQDSAAALAVEGGSGASQNQVVLLKIDYIMLAATLSSTTFKIRAGAQAAGTTTFNGVTGSQQFGGYLNSILDIEEIAA